MNKQKYFISLILVSMLIAGCASPSTEEPSPKEEAVDDLDDTSQVIQVASIETNITIDGDPSDWEGYQVLQSDPEGDLQNGNFDIAAVRAFSNDQFLYVLIETHQPPAEYAQVDLSASAGGRDYILSFRPQASSAAFMGDVTSGQFEAIGEVAGSKSAAGEAVEYKMPLSAFEDASNLKLSVRAMGGTCCEPPDWYAIDEIEQVSVPLVDEIELIMEPIAEIPAVPQVCGDQIASPAPFGSLEPAPISLAEDGYSAEWFVAPSEFNMPQDVIITPDGDILVISVRSGELLRVLDDGKVEQVAANIWSYLGDVDEQGNIYLYSHPRGSIKKITPDGDVHTVIQSTELMAWGDSPIAVGPDGNLYIAINKENSGYADLIKITPSGSMSKLAEVPDFSALKTAPDDKFIAATFDTFGYLSLDDFSFTILGTVPGGNISAGGLAIDNERNIYVSTGYRSHSGKLWRFSLDDSKKSAELIAEIPDNGLSGIEWLPDTEEIIGGQLRAGGLIAIDKNGTIREIVPGNNLISPSGASFSPCGDLVVSNDDGEMMTIIDPAGEVEWFFDYVSFTPPLPFLSFTSEGILYATEGAPEYKGRVIRKEIENIYEQFVLAEFPSGIVYDSTTDTLVVSETSSGCIVRVSMDGTKSVIVEGIEFPQALALDSSGNIYAIVGSPQGWQPQSFFTTPIGGNAVIRITPDGKQTTVINKTPLFALAVDTDDNLFVSESGNVWQVTADGTVSQIAGGLKQIWGLSFDLAGNLYIIDTDSNGIVRIGGFPQGTLSGVIMDETGTPIEDARVQVLSVDPIVVGQVVFTDKNGFFNLPAAPCSYQVIVKAENHQEYSLENIKVIADQEKKIEISLEK